MPPPPDHPSCPTAPRTARPGNLKLALAAGAAAAVLVAALFPVVARTMGDPFAPGLVAGPVVGFAVRLAGRGADRRFAIVAAVLASLGFMGGFVWADYELRPSFTLTNALRLMLTLPALGVHAFSVVLAFGVATRPQARA